MSNQTATKVAVKATKVAKVVKIASLPTPKALVIAARKVATCVTRETKAAGNTSAALGDYVVQAFNSDTTGTVARATIKDALESSGADAQAKTYPGQVVKVLLAMGNTGEDDGTKAFDAVKVKTGFGAFSSVSKALKADGSMNVNRDNAGNGGKATPPLESSESTTSDDDDAPVSDVSDDEQVVLNALIKHNDLAVFQNAARLALRAGIKPDTLARALNEAINNNA